jgi:hypothetical protein
MAKKRKRFMKIELFETSAVGTPAYADAHFNYDCSFMKALKDAEDDYIPDIEDDMEEVEENDEDVKNIERREVEKMPEDSIKTEKSEAVVEVKEAPVAIETKEAEIVKEVIEAKEVKIDEAKVKEIVSASLKEVLDKLSVERQGLVEEKKSKSEWAKTAPLGEIALQTWLKR